MKKTFFLILFLTLFSCKKELVKIPNFDLVADRNVEITINSEVKKALNYLAYISIVVNYECNKNGCGNKLNEGKGNLLSKVDFYFNITQTEKSLIIIESIENNCINNNCISIVRRVQKHTIPIDKIKQIDIQDFAIQFGNPIEKDICTFFIDSEFNANSFKTQFVTSTKWADKNDEITFDEGFINKKSVILQIPLKQAIYLKQSLEVLIKTFNKQ